jgi:hypothetical protein
MDRGAPMSLRFISARNVAVMSSEMVGLVASNTRPRSNCNMDSKGNNPVRNKCCTLPRACGSYRRSTSQRIRRPETQSWRRTAVKR